MSKEHTASRFAVSTPRVGTTIAGGTVLARGNLGQQKPGISTPYRRCKDAKPMVNDYNRRYQHPPTPLPNRFGEEYSR